MTWEGPGRYRARGLVHTTPAPHASFLRYRADPRS